MAHGVADRAFVGGVEFIDSWLAARHQQLDWPGFAVTISRVGNIAYAGAWGLADSEHGKEMTPDHIFQAASQTKPFTAAAVMQLSERQQLHIDDRVTQHIPELQDHRDTRWADVTISQLLSHGAGLARDLPDADFWEQTRTFPGRQEALDAILGQDLVMDPGRQMKYSNVGYVVLGEVIARASGSTYQDYVRDNIVRPLGLRSTGFGRTDQASALGYGRKDSGGKRHPLLRSTADGYDSAAGLYASLGDLCRFYDALIPGNENHTLLTDESKTQMHAMQWKVRNSPNVEYGLGLDAGYIGGRRVVGHGGGYPGYLSKTLVDASDGLVVSGMVNCIDGDGLMMTIGVMEAIDYFRDHASPSSYPIEQFNCRLRGLWKDRQIVATGNSIVSVDPNSWHPFSEAERLEYVDARTLRVVDVNGFEHEGELVHFEGDRVVFGGRTMYKVIDGRNQEANS